MKKTTYVWTLLIGAVIAALSFLFSGIENPTVQNLRWVMFAVGLAAAVMSFGILLVSFLRGRHGGEKNSVLPAGAEYRKKTSIMTEPEIRLYRLLCAALDLSRCTVLPQAALCALVDKVRGGGYRSELFRIADFCIVDARSFEPLLVIELNDASHEREERKLRDEKVAAICADADLPLLTVPLDRSGNVRWLKSELRRFL